eukprot:TRINITY_DN1438_c0_g2_i3.p1 TRINITY_DN1438_c0_g2~~TRINITY_DN1438_c0_g2_i3.p1  ORF type:complete len:245 (+),score=23.92 TRINITY_DN1438_c0_g2_i3:61-735(+)
MCIRDRYKRTYIKAIYLDGRMTGAEVNEIIADIEHKNNNLMLLKIADYFLILSMLAFAAFFVNSLFDRSVGLFSVPFIVCCFSLISSGVWGYFANRITDERIRAHLEGLNVTRLGKKGISASINNGTIKFVVTSDQYKPVVVLQGGSVGVVLNAQAHHRLISYLNTLLSKGLYISIYHEGRSVFICILAVCMLVMLIEDLPLRMKDEKCPFREYEEKFISVPSP